MSSDVILQRMMALHPKVIDLTLDRVHRLLAALGHPERRLPPVVHIAGTNGKGSTLAMIRAGLEADGCRVHAYTSPHLARFHERIRLAGDLITEDALTQVLDRCMAANGPAPITYFEITTVAAILAMAECPADYTLLEVGLGGRLDATNVIEAPHLTVITPVDMDHEAYLGTTLAQIAGEKAGIIKRRVPVVVARQHAAAGAVIEARAEALAAPLLAYGQQWHVREEHGRLVYEDETGLLDLPRPALAGPHQIQNGGTALAALRHLGRGVPEGAMAAAWPGRMQPLRDGALPALAPGCALWLDGGHNPAAGQAIAATLGALPAQPTHLICGMLNTKDSSGYLGALARCAASLTAIDIPGEANTLPAATLAARAADAGLPSSVAPDLNTALAQIAAAHPGARILICGSLYLVGAALRANAPQAQN